MKWPASRWWLLAVSCCAPAAVLAFQNPPPPQFRAGVELFQFEAVVLDNQRQPVHGLHASDFTVFEDGKRQPIVAFSEVAFPPHDGPLTESQTLMSPDVTDRQYADRRLFVLVLDDWELSPEGDDVRVTQDVKNIARSFVADIGPQDLVAVVRTRDGEYSLDFTSDPWKLLEAINAFRPPTPAERGYLSMVTRGHIGGVDALFDVVNNLVKLPQEQKAVVYVSPGQSVRIGGVNSGHAEEAMDTAKENGIRISVIDPAGLRFGRSGGLDFLRTLAEDTGGYSVVNTNDVKAGMGQIFRENSSYYLLGYERNQPTDGKFRKLEVHVDKAGLTVHARTGYRAAPKSDMVAAPTAPFDSEVNAAVRAIAPGTETRHLFTDAVVDGRQLTIATEIASSDLDAGKWQQGADVEVRVTRGAGDLVTSGHAQIAPLARGALLRLPLDPQAVAGGLLHVNVRVTSGSDWLEDGVDAEVDRGGLLGAPLVFRAGSSPRSPLEAVAQFEFSRTERMHVEWPELQTVTDPRARLLRSTGEPLGVTLPVGETQDAASQALTLDMPLSSFAPGEYVIELTAKHDAATTRKLVAFQVVP